MYGYDWLGYGLEISTPYGTVFLQGDDASELYDALESCEDDGAIARILSAYDDISE
jgi:hypothetical protein